MAITSRGDPRPYTFHRKIKQKEREIVRKFILFRTLQLAHHRLYSTVFHGTTRRKEQDRVGLATVGDLFYAVLCLIYGGRCYRISGGCRRALLEHSLVERGRPLIRRRGLVLLIVKFPRRP
ncbi:hypothetical protein CDAR_506941 [Caerostris darwini]|uniref:Uncharacterized protein n=1 Tax=Caerostris darwini TaxID=1538125 RepID=A0AAV4P122_9ARAC|nr:hypothetical protein CDAR_506941 [Caerostris darwini]